MKRVKIKNIRAVASLKKQGYLAVCRKLGVASPDGQWLTFIDADHARIAIEYATPACPPCTKMRKKLPSLGQAVDRVPVSGCKPCLTRHSQTAAAVSDAAPGKPAPTPPANPGKSELLRVTPS